MMSSEQIVNGTRAVRHLQRFMDDEDLVNANSERLPEFWQRCQIVHKDLIKDSDIFATYDDEVRLGMNLMLQAIGEKPLDQGLHEKTTDTETDFSESESSED